MIDIEKPAVNSAREPVDEKQEKDLANTENISGRFLVAMITSRPPMSLPITRGLLAGRPSRGIVRVTSGRGVPRCSSHAMATPGMLNRT